jgi:hypothetical protein
MPETIPTIKLVRQTPVESSSGTWQGVLSARDPLAEWNGKFAEWRSEIQAFREQEETSFFPNRDDEFYQRVHRGWLCGLMSRGEFLATQLIQDHPTATDQLKFLDICIRNLRSTFETWHSLDRAEVKKAG